MENETMFTQREKYHKIEADWYNFAISQGEDCLSGVLSAVVMIQGKSLWLFGVLVGLVGAYLSFAAISIDEVAAWSNARTSVFFSGLVASIPWTISIFQCVNINWVSSFPNSGTKPAKIFFPEFLDNRHRKKLFKAACFKRLEDLNISIDTAKVHNVKMGNNFNTAMRHMFIGFLFFVIYFVGIIVFLNLKNLVMEYLHNCA
jgi:hypothetical protein